MNYRNYGNDYMGEEYNERNYNEGNYSRRGVPGSGRGRRRYSERGRDRRYGEEKLDEMYGAYQDYSDGREEYGAEGQTMKALESMMEAVVDFVKMLKQDASSQKEMQLIEKYIKKLENV